LWWRSSQPTLQANLALTSSDNENALASQLRRLYQPLSDRARPMQDSRLNASQPFNIQIETNTGSEIVSFQLVRNQCGETIPICAWCVPKRVRVANFRFGGSITAGNHTPDDG
jgi:hypothetical protein